MPVRILELLKKPFNKVYEIKKIHESIKYVITLGGILSPIGIPSTIFSIFKPSVTNNLNIFTLVIIVLIFIVINVFLFSVLFAKPKEEFPFGFRETAGTIIKKYKYGKAFRTLGTVFALLFNASILIFLLNPIINPSEQQFKILIANFEGPEPKKYRVTETVIEKLRKATVGLEDIFIQPIDSVITTQLDDKAKSEILNKYSGDVLISGYYTVLSSEVVLKINLKINNKSTLSSFSVYEEVINERDQLILPSSTLSKLELQVNLAGELSHLLFLLLSDYYERKDSNVKAITYLNKAIAFPKLSNEYIEKGVAYYLRARIYEKINRVDSALIDLHSALKLAPTQPKVLSKLGEIFYNKMNYDSAFYYTEKALKYETSVPLIYNLLGCIYYRLKNYPESIDLYNKALILDSSIVDINLNRALGYMALGDFQLAISDFQKYLKTHPNNLFTYENISYSFYALEKPDSSFIYIEKGLLMNPANFKLMQLKAFITFNLGNYNKALNLINEIINKDGEIYQAIVLRGIINYHLNNYELAITDLEKVFYSKTPVGASAYEFLFDSYYELSDFTNAIKIYHFAKKYHYSYAQISTPSLHLSKSKFSFHWILEEKLDNIKRKFSFDNNNLARVIHSFLEIAQEDSALSLYNLLYNEIKNDNSRLSELYNLMSVGYLNLKNYRKAEFYGLKAVKLNSKNYAYYSNLSEIYKENNDISKAVKYVSEAITLNSSNAYLYSQRGSLYGNYLNDFDKANKDFSKSIALDPENWAHYYFRAEFLLKQNRLIEAKLDLDYLYQNKLLNYMVLNTFGKYYIKINSFNEALNSLNISLTMEPNNSEAYYLRSLVFTKLNKKHDAISDLSKSIKIDSTDSDAYYQRGLQYYDLGKYHLAQKDFNNSLKFSKGSKLKELSLKKLNELSMLIK